jgi:hypothetical protein
VEFDISVEPYHLRFDEEQLRASPAFQEIWSLDFLLERLSTRRQYVSFDWINKPE